MKTKRTLSLFLALSMAVSLTVPAMAAEGGYVPGTYTATENGFAGPVTVTVTVDDSTITAITADGNETQGIGSRALEELPQTMLAAQSADVDTVAGATFTSQAVKKAAEAALSAARGEETPALPGAEAIVDEESAGLAGLYDSFTLEFAQQYKMEHPEEYAAFDAGEWFAREWSFYDSKAEYMAAMGLTTEAEFLEDMWVEYTTYTEAYEAAWMDWQMQEEARAVEEYRTAHPGELEGLDLNVLLARRGYREPMEAYMSDFGIATEEEAVTRLLADYVSSRRLAQERHALAEEYRAADPEGWEGFDVDAYLAEEWGWYTKEEFMNSWLGPFYTEEELADYLFIEFTENRGNLWNWGWGDDDGPTLVVNGEVMYDAGLTTADGVSYLSAGELGAILGTDLVGEEPVAIREAALAAGWDVTWNAYRNQVVLLDREKLSRGIIVHNIIAGETPGTEFVEYDLSAFEALVNRLLAAQKWEEGKAYRTTNTYDLTLTAFNSLDGDESYDLTVRTEALVKDDVVDLTVTANAVQLLELLPQASLDKLGAQLGKASFQELRTLLTGCKLQAILNFGEGTLSWNVPLLTLMDDTVTEDTWFTTALDAGDEAVFSGVFAALQAGEWSLGGFLYEMLLTGSGDSYMGAEGSYDSFMMAYGMANTLFGPHTVSERGDTLTWKLDCETLNAALAGVAGYTGSDEEEFALSSLFKEYEVMLSVDRNGRMTADAAVRPNMEGIAAMATQGSWYDAGETALMTWLLGLLDFRETAHSEGTANRSTGTAQFHWKNQFELDVSTTSTRTESRTAPRTAPPAGAETVEL